MYRPVFLIGMMACGKTTLGQALAVAFPQRPFVDLDQMIEREQGMSIAQIFEQRGEAAFRSLESEALRRAAATGGIIACGGGTPCQGGNMEFMLEAGTVVWLKARREVTVRRLLLAPEGQRPLMSRIEHSAEAVGAAVDELEKRRSPYYGRAHHTFDSSRLETAGQVAEAVAAFAKRFFLT